MALVDQQTWQAFIATKPHAHILQTAEWGLFKSRYGWYPKYILNGDTGAMVLFRRLPLKQTLAYIPKGPIGADWEELLDEVTQVARQEGAFLVYVEPDSGENCVRCDQLATAGFSSTTVSIQPRRTIIIPLEGDSENWMTRMKQKTRYNIRLAKRKDVKVEQSSDVKTFAKLMSVTGERDAFGTHGASYYQQVYDYFAPQNACVMLMAAYKGNPLAAIMVFARGERAWYFYGASNNQERNRMPTYLLQWEAMRWAEARGVKTYDLWGVPDFSSEALEAQFTTRSDGLWGVYRFKRGFGGDIVRSAGVYQKILNKPLSAIYHLILKSRKSLVS